MRRTYFRKDFSGDRPNGLHDDDMDDDMEMSDDELYTELDDERREEVNELIGLRVLGVEVWEDYAGGRSGGYP